MKKKQLYAAPTVVLLELRLEGVIAGSQNVYGTGVNIDDRGSDFEDGGEW